MAAPFQSEQWKAERGNRAVKNSREGMIGAALDALRPGMGQDEALPLLGEPDGRRESRWTYRLGALGFGVDLSRLVVEFDAGGRLDRRFIEQG